MNDPAGSHLARDLTVMAIRLSRELRLRHSSRSIPLAQLSILATLYREGAMTTGDLAARERIKPPSVSRSSHALVELGLVDRVPHETDGRQIVLTLTEEGRRIAIDDVDQRAATLGDQLATLTDAQRDELRKAAEILTAIVERVD